MDDELRRIALRRQREEITEHHIYLALAKRASGKNRQTLERLAEDERKHAVFWSKISGQEVAPSLRFLWWYRLLARLFGVTFVLRLRESGEQGAQKEYAKLAGVPGVKAILADEERHEQALIDMLKDERLEHAGSIVLGLNDALVELTGALAGMTLALGESGIVAIAGLVTGLAASLSMAASSYLHSKEDGDHEPLTSALYTGLSYIAVVFILISPYFLFENIFVSLAATLTLAVLVVAGYTFYISVAKRQRFWPRFLEMAAISLVVAGISFLFGLALRHAFGI